MKAYLFLFTLLIIAVLIGAQDLIAQPPPTLPTDVPQAPIDGGLSLLAAAGVSYSAYRLRKQRKAN